MNIKKTKISWFFYAIYIITYLYLGVCIGNTISKILNLGGAALSCIVIVMVFLLAFEGCAAALIVLVKARPKDSKTGVVVRLRRRMAKNNGFFVKELLPALVSYLSVVISRGIYIVQVSGGKISGHVGLYERISSGVKVNFDIFLGVERLYAYLMKGFCILLGNVPDALYILNLICQVILVFCCYLFVRMAAGRVAAFSSSVLFLCIPYFYRMLTVCEPAQLLMALFMAVICILAFVLKRSVFDFGKKGMFPVYLLCGLLSGMLFMLDLMALIIPITVIVVFLVSVQGRRFELLCFLIGMIVGIPVGVVLLNVDVSGTLFSVKTSSFTLIERAELDFGRYITAYESILSEPELLLTLPGDFVLFCVIAFGGIAAVLFFWCEHDVLRIIAVPYLCMIPFACFDTGSVMGGDTGFLIACIGVVTAAMTVGIIYLMGQPVAEVEVHNARRKKKAADGVKTDDVKADGMKTDDVKADADDLRADAENKTINPDAKAGVLADAYSVKENDRAVDNVGKTAGIGTTDKAKMSAGIGTTDKAKMSAGIETMDKAKMLAGIETMDKAEMLTGIETMDKAKMLTGIETMDKAKMTTDIENMDKTPVSADKKKKGAPRFIENPLPLPKKREHREMDYTYKVSSDRMHYDVAVRDEDDFDY